MKDFRRCGLEGSQVEVNVKLVVMNVGRGFGFEGKGRRKRVDWIHSKFLSNLSKSW
jgi:hypothetical protein